MLSAPIQQLMDDHVSLKAAMHRFYEVIEDIEVDSSPAVIHLFVKLHQQISSFTSKLNAHSKHEEEGLFPMMARHLGTNDRTIDMLESEHEKAERHLQDFLTEADKVGASLSENDVQWITVYAFQAHATLTQHFAKEEKVLFPLAEKLLSMNEKEKLERLFRSL